ncbi:MFS transporter [Catellatospora vulcania]|uniref:MFS transporter n=1 Tax=Catellatospora vulcania TaxID=1460450 RepID=UPI0012D495F8|nr:MFS transporter [Catellatospora vulcania]
MKGLVGLLIAGTVSKVGSVLTFLAVPWLVLVTTGSPSLMGLAAAAELLPYVLIGPLGAPLVDRIGPRRVSIVADLGSAVVMAAVALGQRGGFGLLLVLLVLAGALRGLGDCAKRVLLPSTIAASGVDMTRATTVYDGVNRLAGLLGAAAGGVLIAWLEAPGALLLDGVSFVACAMLVAALVPAGTRDTDDDAPPPEPYLTALRGGVDFLRGSRLMTGILAMLFVTNLADQANAAVFVPVWVDRVLGSPEALGWVSAAFGLGAVLGNVVFTALAPRAPRYAVFTIGFLIGGSPRLAVMALADDLTLVLVAGFASGLAMAAVNPILAATMFERVPAHLQARVLSLSNAIGFAGIPLGSLLGGWAVQHLGLTPALLIFGACYLGATLLPVLSPGIWREMDRRPTPTGAPGTPDATPTHDGGPDANTAAAASARHTLSSSGRA